MHQEAPMPEAPAPPDSSSPSAEGLTDLAARREGDPSDDWLGIESVHPLTWLPSDDDVQGVLAC